MDQFQSCHIPVASDTVPGQHHLPRHPREKLEEAALGDYVVVINPYAGQVSTKVCEGISSTGFVGRKLQVSKSAENGGLQHQQANLIEDWCHAAATVECVGNESQETRAKYLKKAPSAKHVRAD